MKIAVIPARGGSKRIPRKNIKLFAGKPMIAYAIEAAKVSGLFEHILVSTDDHEISAIAQKLGAEVPFERPSELADDYAPTVPVIAHAITASEALGWKIDKVCCIYPCVPFIQANDLKAALRLLDESDAKYSFPITEFSSAIQRALRRANDGRISSFYLEYELIRTQDLEPAYYDAGQFYWGTRDAWLTTHRIHANGVSLVIPQWRTVDIDTLEDWIKAEIIAPAMMNKITTSRREFKE
jgi:pseudaminic acid cytidylyltransferase